VVLDLRSDEGRELALELVRRADVVIENFSPGVMDRLGLGWDVVRVENPRAVLVSITGFGRAAGRLPGYDLLEGVRVLDFTTSLAGPYATMLLADLGADVVKLERPGGGDDARAWGPPFLHGESLFFLSANRNKRSLALDVTTPDGREALAALVRRADVVAVNQLPRAQRKLGLAYEDLVGLRPDLVHVSITGFGLEGTRAEHTCYDLIAEGWSGVMDLTGEIEGEPQKVGTPAADLLAGTDAALAVVAAQLARARTGEGRKIEVSLVESMTRFMAPRIVPYLGTGSVPRRSGARDSVIAIYQTFHAADAPMTLALGNDAIWTRFWQAVGRPERAADEALASNKERRERRAELVAEIAEILATRPRAEWLALFAEAKVPAGPINRVDEIAGDDELRRRGLFYAMDGAAGRVPQVGLGIRFDDAPVAPRRPPPALGEHGPAVLREWLGWDEAAIARLTGTNSQAEEAR
jgi:crotonobetainyl-CoA:carnitine CoA-transferase CaiB-like acyl-CoA transferase